MEDIISAQNKLPQHLENQRTKIHLTAKHPSHVDTHDHHSEYIALGYDNSFNYENWKSNFSIDIKHLDAENMIFDVKGITPPLANALRRILINSVPTMAIENVYITDNTSILPDEYLAHRLGLIPIKADPREFEYRNTQEYTDVNTLVFKLKVKCTKRPDAKSSELNASNYDHLNVYSSDLIWEPQGDQADRYTTEMVGPIHDDILIVNLRPGQSIELTCYCQKSNGKDHAKWSPVATAYYRLMPIITLLEPVKDKDAEELQKLCGNKVIEIENGQAVVKRPRNSTTCRGSLADPKWDKLIKMERNKEHFMFYVQCVGMLSPQDVVEEALHIFVKQVETIQESLKAAQKLMPTEEAQIQELDDDDL